MITPMNADDYNINKKTSEFIVYCIENGYCDTTTVMTV